MWIRIRYGEDRVYLPCAPLSLAAPVLVGLVLHFYEARNTVSRRATVDTVRARVRDVLSLTSSRNLGSVGFPLDEGIFYSFDSAAEWGLRGDE